ncbi:MAG: hypothetical protein JWM68_4214 [Verrucomicrobiales bacterium]|nr:hypothetical protein [Verrucomicrobiales bacterium]
MKRIAVMQIVDSLAVGGLERMAVNVANSLPSEHYRSHLCVTRAGGDLEEQVSSQVAVVHLSRKSRFDLRALLELRTYILEHEIQILHAHGSSLFFAAISSLLQGDVKLVWHDHFGRFETEERSTALYRMTGLAVDGVIGVTEPLADWARQQMHARQVWYIANFATGSQQSENDLCDLPGTKGSRVVCVANFRPQKDHINLLKAFATVVRDVPEAHLILLGAVVDPNYLALVNKQIDELNLSKKVTCLGSRSDVHSILQRCDVGVLSSVSEGLPLALLEYGAAKLASISTDVGQCAEVLDHGDAGILVPPSSSEMLGEALRFLLQQSEARRSFANAFERRVSEHYSAEAVIRKICGVYEAVLNKEQVHAHEWHSFSQ